ncbi:MAG TPA: replicative DNA helicase [Thermoanaerobaculia bacterium]|nr:replicative DNA helicase [Thermoanaerobaculia bacterium]HUM28858.1 replicative DNA helicase [Thermoanaerobaculia bacterium]HXK67208.1 replicative DNA helicase [Thermoanaerobaculia bacterium]
MDSSSPMSVSEVPRHVEAEKSLLAVVLLDEQTLNQVASFLRPEDFYLQEHQHIFGIMLELSQENKPIDLVTLKDELSRKGVLEKAGGVAYISGLVDMVPDVGNILTYADIVKEKATLRSLIHSSGEIIRMCLTGRQNARSILDSAEKSVFDIAEGSLNRGFVSLRDVVADNLKMLEDMERGKGHVTGLPTGFIKLDDYTSGFQPGDLVIVAGRPGMGKTSFCLNVAQNMAITYGYSVGFFSLEMSKEQLGYRLMCAEAEVDLQKMRAGFLSKEDYRHLAAATDKLSRARIFIDDTAGVDIIEVRSKARRLQKEHGLDAIMIDYLQLMRSHAKFENRNLELADISRNLKALSKELRIPVVALSQLSRQPERRGKDSRPQLADLRESGALEQDADLVIFLYREEYYKKEDTPEDKKGLAEVIIAKQRNGPTGTAHLVFLQDYTKFMNWKEEPAGDVF